MVLDAALLNAVHYGMDQRREAIQGNEKHPYLDLGVVANENEASEMPLTAVAKFTYIYIYI